MRAEPLTAITGFAALLREHGLVDGVAEQQADGIVQGWIGGG